MSYFEPKCGAYVEIGWVRHALRDAVAGVEGVGREWSGQLPQVVRFVDFCVEEFAGAGESKTGEG